MTCQTKAQRLRKCIKRPCNGATFDITKLTDPAIFDTTNAQIQFKGTNSNKTSTDSPRVPRPILPRQGSTS